jgi:predicted glutamine amidotransferase
MCRLFGMSGGAQPLRAEFWLLDAPDSLTAQSYRNPDGTGLGIFDRKGHAVVYKAPISAYSDTDFAREARRESSCTFLAHIRFASTGALTLANTHPFEQEGRLFAHNGVLAGLPQLENELGEDRALVEGETDSERLFALITRETRRRRGDVRAGIVAAASWAADNRYITAAASAPACIQTKRCSDRWWCSPVNLWTMTPAGANSNPGSCCTSAPSSRSTPRSRYPTHRLIASSCAT